MKNVEEIQKLLHDFRDATWETGWYAGAIEKNAVHMTDEQIKEYSNFHNESLNKRHLLWNQIIEAIQS